MTHLLIELTKFMHMGGYAIYVWPAYFIAFVVLVLNIYLPLRKQQQIIKKLAQEQPRDIYASTS